ncbi:MAG: hypothetical protein KJP25_07610 [Gammaproteobacteria bacterium]|nr:hypothetical protein [Gammaproteobacteria bacterium]NND40239.1 hypothetical protein [Pseudomonadales bacterium]NNL11337.1 hypothetical protein [Pseudomonadales bacterium]
MPTKAKAKVKAKSKDNKFIDLARDVIYASLGAQKAAYDMGSDKYEAFAKARKKDVRNYIKRGEEMEVQIKERYEEFKGADNLLAKGVVGVEDQLEKVSDLAADMGEKVTSIADKIVSATGIKKRQAKAPARKRAPAKRKAA